MICLTYFLPTFASLSICSYHPLLTPPPNFHMEFILLFSPMETEYLTLVSFLVTYTSSYWPRMWGTILLSLFWRRYEGRCTHWNIAQTLFHVRIDRLTDGRSSKGPKRSLSLLSLESGHRLVGTTTKFWSQEAVSSTTCQWVRLCITLFLQHFRNQLSLTL